MAPRPDAPHFATRVGRLISGVRRQLLGYYFVDRSLIDPEQLKDALELQALLDQLGVHRPLGRVLIDLGYASPAEVDAALAEQTLAAMTDLQPAS